MNIAIIGFDREGKASFDFLSKQGHTITICDLNETLEVPVGVESRLGDTYLDNLTNFDLIVRTPGLHPSKILEKNPGITDKITSGTNLFFENCPTKNIIGVTGTKGKGTTSTLISHMLKADGKDVYLLGNIGTPMLGALDKLHEESWVVLELSNFQLIDLKHSPHIAVVLMVTEEHLDWHEDMEEYIAAKQQLFIHQESDDTAIYFADNENSLSIADATEGNLIPYFKKPGAIIEQKSVVIDGQIVCHLDDIALIGTHNWQNVCAATTAVWQVTKNISAIKEAITNFTGLPFRIEFRREASGIRYYNDSFATGPGAATAAIAAVKEPKVLIIGGYDRMLNLNNLVKTIKDNNKSIRKIVLIGASADRMAESLSRANYTNFTYCDAKDMDTIVATATSEAQDGDAVLFSPSFASFDMFNNFEERGLAFNSSVDAL